MKFGKRLQQQIRETLPGWSDKFLSYKELKKLVRLISAAPPLMRDGSRAEAEFVCLLNGEIDKFNAFFVEQEEDFIIRHRVCSLFISSFFFFFEIEFWNLICNFCVYLVGDFGCDFLINCCDECGRAN